MECEPWVVRAFGVELAFAFELSILRAAAVDRAADPTTLELTDFVDPPSQEGRRLAWMPDGEGGTVVDVREHPGVGIAFDAGSRGRFLITPDARHVACARPSGPERDWQHFLVGQVLPLVAALRGLHVIHASAISLGDAAVAFAGRSGAGKSTLATHLARAGHPMLAEDVLALRVEEGEPIAEPGVSLAGLPRAPDSLPLRALYLLDDARPGMPAIEPLPAPSPPELMATTFVPYLSGGASHLEFAATLARSVAVARVRVDRTRPPHELAARIERHAESANRGASFLPA